MPTAQSRVATCVSAAKDFHNLVHEQEAFEAIKNSRPGTVKALAASMTHELTENYGRDNHIIACFRSGDTEEPNFNEKRNKHNKNQAKCLVCAITSETDHDLSDREMSTLGCHGCGTGFHPHCFRAYHHAHALACRLEEDWKGGDSRALKMLERWRAHLWSKMTVWPSSGISSTSNVIVPVSQELTKAEQNWVKRNHPRKKLSAEEEE